MLIDILKNDSMTQRDFVILDDEKIYVWYDIYEDGYKDGNIIQNFIPSYISFIYQDMDYDFKEKEIKAYKEYLKEDGTWESVFINTFIVTDIQSNDTTKEVSVKGFDFGLKYTEQYVSELDYSTGTITMQMVSDEINTKLGMNNALIDVNANFIFDSDQFTGTGVSYGTVISMIAGMSGNRASIIQDQLVYKFANENSKVLNKGEYVSLDDKRDTHPITILVIGQENIQGQEAIRRDEELIALYGENYLILNDNPIAYTIEKREELIDAIFNKVKGFGYSSFVATETNRIDLNIGDVLEFENSEGQLIKSIVLRKTINSTEIQLEAPSITNASINYKRPEKVLTTLKKVEIIANQAENTATTAIQNTEQLEYNVESLEQDINNTYQDLNTKLDGKANEGDLIEISNRMEEVATANDVNYGFIEDIKVNGVTVADSRTGVKLSDEGIEVDKTNALTKSKMDETGFRVTDATGSTNETLLYAGVDETTGEAIVQSKNINVEKYLTIGKNSRIEDYGNGTGIFYVGGN